MNAKRIRRPRQVLLHARIQRPTITLCELVPSRTSVLERLAERLMTRFELLDRSGDLAGLKLDPERVA